MQLPIVVSSSSELSLQQQLVEQIEGLISRKLLLPGTRIPSSRELAGQLGLSRRTVVLSYELLLDDGVIETRIGRGTFVSNRSPQDRIRVAANINEHRTVPGVELPSSITTDGGHELEGMNLFQPRGERLLYDFRIGKPDPLLFPRNHWRRIASEYLDTFTRFVSDYADPAGHLLLRDAIAQHLRIARGIVCRPEQVIITAGAQEGLNLVGRLLNIEGKPVIVEDPCYKGAALAFLGLGGKLVPVGVTSDGLDTDALPRNGGRLGYVTPSHQFPLGVTMSQARRTALIAWARRTGTLLLEDDYDSDFRHNSSPLMALAAMGPECVVYLGTFSKSIGPGLRMGYAVVPEHLADAASAIKSVMNNGHPWFEQSIMAQFISSGAFERHLGRMRTRYSERRNALMGALADAFPETSTSGHEGGMHLVWELGDTLPLAPELQEWGRRVGVGISCLAASPTYVSRNAPQHDRIALLGYACLTVDEIQMAIEQLSRTVTERWSITH